MAHTSVTAAIGYAHLRRFGHCPALAISASYPEHKWQLWMFDSVPKGFWKVEENRRQFFEAAKAKLGVSQLDDWYKIKANALYELKGMLSFLFYEK
jgi:negative regulator of sigma E activity